VEDIMIKKIIVGVIGLSVMLHADIMILHASNDGKTRPSNIPYLQKLQTIANQNNIKIKFKPMPWNRALLMIEYGRSDGVINASYKEERAKYAHYPMIKGKVDGSRRLNPGETYYIYKNVSSNIKWDGEKFQGDNLKVGAIEKYAVIEDLKKYTNLKIVTNAKLVSLIKELMDEKLSAIAQMQTEMDALFETNPEFRTKIIRLKEPVRKKDYHIIWSKKTYKEKKQEMDIIWNGLKRYN
jgi:hypothetical protein